MISGHEMQRNLTVGEVVQAAEIRRIAEPGMAREAALGALERRAYSTRELSIFLSRRGYGPQVVAETTASLVSLGLLDDARFAEGFVRSRISSRRVSRWTLRRDLARKGVPRETADTAIHRVMGDAGVDDVGLARAQGARKWKSLSKLDLATARRRLAGFLQRRGFDGDAIRTVVRELAR
jgi:regulatory protein